VISNRPSRPSGQPWVLRSDLRLALVTGLSAGFGLLSDISYGYYLPMTTAAVLSSTYGDSLKLGIQRLLGSLMGVILLLIFSRGLNLPLAMGLGLALGTTRLLGGVLGLQVGYKVAGNIIIMGWLVHNSVETTWGPLRLFWTVLGIAISLWASRWIWPSRTIPNLHRQWAGMVEGLAQELAVEAESLRQEHPQTLDPGQRRARRTHLITQINGLRQQGQIAQIELGVNPENHPLHRLWSELDLLCSQLLSVIDGLRGLPAAIQSPDEVRELHSREVAVLEAEIGLLGSLTAGLRSPALMDRQHLMPGPLQDGFQVVLQRLQPLDNQLLVVTEHGLAGLSDQRLRQIVLRTSLLSLMAMVTRDFTPGLAGLQPVRPKPAETSGSPESGELR